MTKSNNQKIKTQKTHIVQCYNTTTDESSTDDEQPLVLLKKPQHKFLRKKQIQKSIKNKNDSKKTLLLTSCSFGLIILVTLPFLSYYYFMFTLAGQTKLLNITGQQLINKEVVQRNVTFVEHTQRASTNVKWSYLTEEPEDFLAKYFWYTTAQRKKQAKHFVLLNPNPKISLDRLAQQGWLEPYRNQGYEVTSINIPIDTKGHIQGLDVNSYFKIAEEHTIINNYLKHVFKTLGLLKVLDQVTIAAPQRYGCALLDFARYHKMGQVITINSDCGKDFSYDSDLQHISKNMLSYPGIYWVNSVSDDNQNINPGNHASLEKKISEHAMNIQYIDISKQLPAGAAPLRNWQYSFPEEFLNLMRYTALDKTDIDVRYDPYLTTRSKDLEALREGLEQNSMEAQKLEFSQ